MQKKEKLSKYHTDGGTLNNGRFGSQSSVICATDALGTVLFFENVGDKTNNEAELLAILKLLDATEGDLHILCDSQLAVNLIAHQYHTQIDRLRDILIEIQKRGRIFKIEWIPREKNKAGHHIENTTGL